MGGASSELPLLRELSLAYLVDNIDMLGSETKSSKALLSRVQGIATLRRGVQARLKERSAARKAVEAENTEKEKAQCVVRQSARAAPRGRVRPSPFGAHPACLHACCPPSLPRLQV